MKFDIAAEDHEQAQADQEYHLQILEVAGERYAAVRPVGSAFSAVLKDSYAVMSDPKASLGLIMNFLAVCFDQADLTAAIRESGEYAEDEDLSDEDRELTESNSRITSRMMNRHDDLGEVTLARVMVGLVEAWSGKDTGSPQDYLPPSKPAGKRSTARTSSKESTSFPSSTAPRRGTSQPSTRGSRATPTAKRKPSSTPR